MSLTTSPLTTLEGVRQVVFQDRYSLKDNTGKPLESHPEEMWARVATAIAAIEGTQSAYWEDEFYSILKDFKFIPGGRILSGAGTGNEVTYYNCFVLPSPEDSRGGIFKNIQQMTEIMARGGGVGVNISSLRPRGSYIKTVNGHSSGPVSWAEIYSVTTGRVIQQGGSRRGALMLMLDDDHPDIMEFITAKAIDPMTGKPVALEYANVSVAVSDRFMQAVKDDADWVTQFPTEAQIRTTLREDIIAGAEMRSKVAYHKTYKAREIWDAICKSAWATAEPGIVFMERYNKQSNTYYYEDIACVNPCGEQGLGAWQVCNLGAMNLAAYVIDEHNFDYYQLGQDVATAVRFLDNVIDSSFYFSEENRKAQLGTRRIGLGTLGLADALIKLKLAYGSPESLGFIEEVYSLIAEEAYLASAGLAAEKGRFPNYRAAEYSEGYFIKNLSERTQNVIAHTGVRNAVLLTQAPTGSTSLVAGVSSGIEPVFSFAMKRVDRTGESYIYHPLLKEWQDDQRATLGEQSPMGIAGQLELPPRPAYFVESGDLRPEQHIAVQAAIQKYTDSSISKTVNGPSTDTVEDVERLYMMAYDSGCKGVTYYRDGSRDAVLTRIEPEKAQDEKNAANTTPDTFRERPVLLHGYTRNITAPEGTVNITVNEDEDGPFEVFVNVGRAGSDVAALAEGMGRLISLLLRVPSSMSPASRLDSVVAQLRGIGGSRFTGFGPNQVRSLADAVAKVLETHGRDSEEVKTQIFEEEVKQTIKATLPSRKTGNMCPECSQFTLIYEEGCKKCINCGHSEC